MRPVHALLVPVLLVLGLLLLSALGPGDETMHWFWNRVAARLDWSLLGVAVGLSLVAMALPRALPWPVVAILGYAPFARVPQSGIDTALYVEYALRFLDQGVLRTLWLWPEQVWSTGLHHMPLVPLVYGALHAVGAPWRVATAAFAALLVYGTHRLGGPRAAVLLLGVPFLWAQSGLFLVDIPLTALVALGLAGLMERRPAGALVAVGAKVSGGAFLLGPALALGLRPWESRRRAGLLVLGGVVAIVLLFFVIGHHTRPLQSYGSAARSLLVHLTPWTLLFAALGLARLEGRRAWVLLAGLGAAFVILRYAPAGHAARYALPLVPLLCAAGAAALGDRGANAVAAFGLVLGISAYRPLAIHHQAANLDEALAAIPADAVGVELVGVPGDPESVPPWFLTPIAQLRVDAPVVYRGALTRPVGRSDRPPRWWNEHSLDSRFLAPIDADFRLVLGGAPDDARPPEGWTLWSVHDRYQGSSFAFPTRVLLFSRRPAKGSPPTEE